MARVRMLMATLIMSTLAGAGLEVPKAEPEPAAPGLRLVVNVATYRLHVYENGERTRSYPIAVGMPGHRTPRGSYRISRVIWNPWWHPPKREWARGAGPTPPGPGNPMGRVKMYFRNLYFIHGTPNEDSLGSAASHGCIRMANEDAMELARLVHRYGSPDVSRSTLDRLAANSRRTRTIWLERPIPLQIVHDVAEVREEPVELLGAELR